MARYVISDTHLDHENIIEYCDRPFDSVDEMNRAIVENWNSVVTPDDTVLFLGDLAMWGSEAAEEWVAKLNGSLLFVRGNHDSLDESSFPHPICDACVVAHGKFRFGCVHRPERADEVDGEWTLSGHHHNNDTREYPFVDPGRNRVNLSVELLDYTPISMDRLCDILDRGERFETLADAE